MLLVLLCYVQRFRVFYSVPKSNVVGAIITTIQEYHADQETLMNMKLVTLMKWKMKMMETTTNNNRNVIFTEIIHAHKIIEFILNKLEFTGNEITISIAFFLTYQDYLDTRQIIH